MNASHTPASQESCDATQPALSPGQGFSSFAAEYDALVNRKRDLDAILVADHSKGARSRAQAAVRREFGSDRSRSFHKWMRVRTELDEARAAIVAEITEIENRRQLIKALAVAERRQDSASTGWSQIASEQLAEMRQIRQLLETLVEHLCPDEG